MLEEGAAAIRAGQAGEADAVLTRGLEALKRDTRPKFPSEEAIWHYKRGLARLNLNQQPAAAADLQYALGAGPSEWIRGKIQLEMGKLADLAGRRTDAVNAYRTAARLCGASADPMCEKEANRLPEKSLQLQRPITLRLDGAVETHLALDRPGRTRPLRDLRDRDCGRRSVLRLEPRQHQNFHHGRSLQRL